MLIQSNIHSDHILMINVVFFIHLKLTALSISGSFVGHLRLIDDNLRVYFQLFVVAAINPNFDSPACPKPKKKKY